MSQYEDDFDYSGMAVGGTDEYAGSPGIVPVPPEGSPFSKVCLVGEAPGRHEQMKGVPFIGPAGKLLDKMLRLANIGRQETYILNTIDMMPRNINDLVTFKKPTVVRGGKSIQDPRYTRYGAAYCTTAFFEHRERLLNQINASKSNVVVPLGRIALLATTGYPDIIKRRGSILSSEHIPGKKIIPTIHPSAALRQHIYEYFMLFDLKRIKEDSYTSDLNLPQRRLVVEPTFDQAMCFIEECMKHELVGFDIETKRVSKDGKFTDWEISCISLAYSPEDAISIPFAAERQGYDYFTIDREFEIWKALRSLLTNKNIRKVGQNIIFDASFVMKKMGFYPWPVEDTMIASGILAPDLPKGLDFLTSTYTREPYYKDEGKQHIKVGSSARDFWIYSAKDSAVLMEIFPRQEQQLKAQGNYETYKTQRDLIRPLLYMGYRGIVCNKEGRQICSDALKREVDELQLELNRVCGQEINPNSPDQVKNYFYVKKGLKPYKTDGRASVDEDALKQIKAKGFVEADIILDIRERAKLRGTYMEMGLDPDNRIRSSFNPVGTKTGRLSSKKTIFGTGGNLQNIPPNYKRYMLADEGYVLYDVDLSQAENRIVAYIAPEMRMIKAFEDGIDIHSLTAALISGIPPLDIKAQDELFKKTKDRKLCAPIGLGNKTWRYWGKCSNHSLNYDIGPNTFALNLEISVRDARFLKTKYMAAYPGVSQFHNWIQNELRASKIIINCFGRHRKFYERWGHDLFKEAYAQIPQSTVADKINNHGLLPLHDDPLEQYRYVELLDQVHDSIVFQIPVKCGWEYHASVLINLKRSLEIPIRWRASEFVIPADTEMGKNMASLEPIKVTDLNSTAALLEEKYAILK